jgi:hypothetical protein
MSEALLTVALGNIMTIQEIIANYPRAYHMAESGTWDSIRRHGLMSTNALLDLFEVNGHERQRISEQHRPESITITHPKHGKAVIRDQKPMRDSALLKCLDKGITPTDWYRTLNRKVFFWLSEERLDRLLGARAYNKKTHCVIIIDTAKLLGQHADHVRLCHINSGSTIYRPQSRGANTFKTIGDYPFDEWRQKRGAKDAVVELVINYSVPDLVKFVLRVEERQGANLVRRIFEKTEK